MKNCLLILLMLFVSNLANAQARTLLIQNKTPCEVRFRIVASGAGGCAERQNSEIIRLKAKTTMQYDLDAMLPPGLKDATGFVGAALITGEDSCNTKTHYIGLPCAFRNKSKSFVQYRAACSICWTIFAVWEPDDGKGNGRLVFNP